MHAEGSFCTSYAPSIPWFSLRVTGGVLCHDLVERINSASQVLFSGSETTSSNLVWGPLLCQGQYAARDRGVVCFLQSLTVHLSWLTNFYVLSHLSQLEWKFLSIFLADHGPILYWF